MTSFQLLQQRVSDDRRYKIRDLKAALDWTVWLYILIPALVIGVAYYRSWWLVVPDWLAVIPEQAAVFPLFLIATTWSFRIYTEEADQVYLLQSAVLSKGLKKWGMAHSLLKGMLVTFFGIGVALPLLITGWGWSVERVAVTGLFLLLISWNAKTCRYFIDLFVPSIWVKWIPVGCVNLLSIVILVVVSQVGWKFEWAVVSGSGSLLLLLFVQLRARVKMRGTFFHEAVIERGHKQSITKFLMGNVGVAPATLFVRKQPFLFRGSKRIRKKRFPQTRMIDLYTKWLLRSVGKMHYYLQVIGWGTAAILLLPLVVKVVVLLFALYALIGLSRADWREFSEGSYSQLFQWETSLHEEAEKQALKLVSMPSFLLLCFVTGFSFPGWMGLLLFPLGGWFVFKMAHRGMQTGKWQDSKGI
ncbi:ABC transporter permease [Guptibacillus hwajinpoensis]|uniref:ABC transporter permease n=1 Tax=Guptibacillus hwajinpoensis TaxID=208199 RepID=UPI001CD451BE|nr:ABC transporter permease [Pseudalkalibacillus hwajinpoensis]MCA0991164.1 ABC transporter permease [Pseudalkalibacillus hwajinpoensis]